MGVALSAVPVEEVAAAAGAAAAAAAEVVAVSRAYFLIDSVLKPRC